MNDLIPVTYGDQRILTTEQLAEVYETDIDNIKKNFSNNKERFIENKHYYLLKGDALKQFKLQVNNIDSQNELQVTESDPQNELQVTNSHPQISNMVRNLYLWTERGANRHSKR